MLTLHCCRLREHLRPSTIMIQGIMIVMMLGLAGCATERLASRKTRTSAEDQAEERRLVERSMVGRVQQIESIGEQGAHMSAEQASSSARQLAVELHPNQPTAVRSAIIRALGKIDSPASLEGLRTGLQDAEPKLRAEACQSLAHINAPAAMDLLIETLGRETDTDVRLAAVRGLGDFHNPLALSALGDALNDRDPAVQYLAMQSMSHMTGESLGNDVRKWKEVARNPQSVLGEPKHKWLR